MTPPDAQPPEVGGGELTGKWDADAGFNYDTAMKAADLSKGDRVKMPSGQVLVVDKVSKPDKHGVVRVRYHVPEDQP